MAHHEITKEQAEDLKARVERAFNDRDTKGIEAFLGHHLVDHGKLIQHWEFSADQGLLAQLEAQTP